MNFIAWIVVGLIAGFLGSKIVDNKGQGLIMDIILGIVGAMVGGFLFGLLGIHGNGLLYSIIVATVGAIVILVIYHKLM